MTVEIVVALTVLTIAAYIDWKEKRVPNWITFPAWGAALLYHGVIGGFEGFSIALAAGFIGLATLILPYALNGMGAGDVKLMAAVGAWVGITATLQAFVWIAIIGGVMGVYSIIRSQQLRERAQLVAAAGLNLVNLRALDSGVSSNAPQKILLPYGVPIAFGFYAYFLVGGLI